MTHEFELGTDGPKVLLVGIDGTITSLRAGAYAAGLARRQRSRLVVVYVARPSAFVGLAPGAAAVARQADHELAEDLRRQVVEGGEWTGIKATFHEVYGDPYTEIVRLADEVNADGVIVGASMRAGHRFAGSLAIRLVKTGKWPVTVVP
ncbi:universal stress protein [Phytohabitans flavus]|uniref:Universal stress protein A n=1 Tax=Phytohabitans flavus TaxID=1076124 RepID=A0A6F8XSZ5_9ACTN|nr:universal stress protein [Phytohabitans flavus]BCB76972.1 universal stress protein A [Phytohabitans flavus]